MRKVVSRLLLLIAAVSVLLWLLYGTYGPAWLATQHQRLGPAAPSLESYRTAWHTRFILWNSGVLIACFVGFFCLQWRQLSAFTRGLALTLVASAALVNLLLLGLLRVPFGETTLEDSLYYLLNWEWVDSWQPMMKALEIIRYHPDQLLYTTLFFQQQTRFQYPPTSLLVADWIRGLEPPSAWRTGGPYYLAGAAEWLSWSFVVLLIVWTSKLLALAVARYRPQLSPISTTDQTARYLLIAALTITFYPLVAGFSHGQIQTWMNALFAVMAWAWMKERKVLAGVLAALLALIKPQYALLFVWGLARRQQPFVLAGLVTAGLGLAVSLAKYGPANHLDYLPVLNFLSQHGEVFYPNQTVNGLLNRWFGTANSVTFDHVSFPPYHPLVYGGMLASAALFAIAALRLPRRGGGGIEDFLIAALTCVFASPIAWYYHYGVLLPVYALLLPLLLHRPVFGQASLPLLAMSYLLAGNLFSVLNPPQPASGWVTLPQSYMFFAALYPLACLYRLRAKA